MPTSGLNQLLPFLLSPVGAQTDTLWQEADMDLGIVLARRNAEGGKGLTPNPLTPCKQA